MSKHAIDHQAAPQGGVVIPFRAKPVTDTQTAPEWRPMLPPDLFTPEIGADGIAVYGALCLYVDGQTGDCWPSQETIGKRIGLTRKRVNEAIKVLEMSGLVEITHQYDRGMKRSNLYHLRHQKTANVQMSRIDTTLSPGDTTDVPQGDNRCVTGVHKPNVSEPNDKEPDEGGTPQTPRSKTKPRQSVFVDGFDDFYKRYPKHKDPEGAAKAWSKLRPDPDLQAVILADIAARRLTQDWLKQNGQFIPYPATYLNGKRWTDEMGETVTANGTASAFDETFAEGIRRAKAKMNGTADGDVIETTGRVVR